MDKCLYAHISHPAILLFWDRKVNKIEVNPYFREYLLQRRSPSRFTTPLSTKYMSSLWIVFSLQFVTTWATSFTVKLDFVLNRSIITSCLLLFFCTGWLLSFIGWLSFSTISGHRFYVLKSFYVLKVSYVLQVFCVPRFSCAIQSSYFNDANFYHVFNVKFYALLSFFSLTFWPHDVFIQFSFFHL